MKIGVLGGTFDPIHFTHLFIAETARRALQLERVLFIPAGQPPHRLHPPEAGGDDRYAMTLLATATHPHFHLSRLELDRSGPSYTVETLRALRRQYGEEAELFLILGADQAAELPTWHRPEELIRLCTVLAPNRPGTPAERLAALPEAYRARVRPLPVPGSDVSATEVRRRVRAGEPIRYLVPAAVEAYIRKHGLYRAAPAAPNASGGGGCP